MRTWRFTLGLLIAATPLAAAPAWYETGPIQPYCADVPALQEYRNAVTTHDKQWMDSLTACALLKPGLKVQVLARFPLELDTAATIRVRRGGLSIIGYTITRGLTLRP